MRLTQRECMLGIATVAAVLYGGSIILARPKLEEWRELRRQQAEMSAKLDSERGLLDQRDLWQKRFDDVKKLLPNHPIGSQVDIHWLTLMDAAAGKNGLTISQRQAGEEQKLGDVYELPIECKEWEGSLDALVHFLFDLQNGSGMLDVRQLLVKPFKKAQLRGRFALYCAYTRGGAAVETAPQPAGAVSEEKKE